MSEAKHSPLPWRKGDVPGTIVCDNLDGLPCQSMRHYGGELVCESCQDSVREFIIRAANCHDDLVEALGTLSLACGEADALQHAGLAVPADVWAEVYQANMKARAAIAKAEAK